MSFISRKRFFTHPEALGSYDLRVLVISVPGGFDHFFTECAEEWRGPERNLRAITEIAGSVWNPSPRLCLGTSHLKAGKESRAFKPGFDFRWSCDFEETFSNFLKITDGFALAGNDQARDKEPRKDR
jgi:hypothetical protein